ncbi:FAD-dependent monooxygenase [Caenimonas koreensis]|uniref:FAD-dependent oxidoreductase n=1 Tax=Caenimonas koreensis DSM 17982 TaxID=1121255 RepID=A0A844AUK0_9BURK|nr:FAD-dependent monooxygenase [Caenimonas koreensis]MRD47784.1 FAD-dependent oxidoreductase [Caenimonas koreensis DSM 17982]
MGTQIFIAGGGIGGLATALACVQAGFDVRLFERAVGFSEVGAGLQLGPNATRRLQAMGLGDRLQALASFPSSLRIRSALTGKTLGQLSLGDDIAQRYGAPYATMHRADLQVMLLDAVCATGVDLRTGAVIESVVAGSSVVSVSTSAAASPVECDVLVGADGLWSAVRRYVAGATPPSFTGHLAYRGLIKQTDLPAAMRQRDVHVWLGPRLHVVAYPVRRDELLNVVAIVQGEQPDDLRDWDQAGVTAQLHAALGDMCAPLRELIHAIHSWRLWALNDRPAVRGAAEMASGRIALVGDAAHPMRPYLAQGAAMAIEDGVELARCLAMVKEAGIDVPLALSRYALNRWQRNAQVQIRAQGNGDIFHSTGVVRWGRDIAMRVLGEGLLDQPWLYRG